MKRYWIFAGTFLFLGASLLISCVKDTPGDGNSEFVTRTTRAYGDKTPKIMVYVETNDVNPLNAGDYYLPDGKPLIDIVEFFASNIHKRVVNGVVEPTLYLNPELTRLLEPDPLDPENTGYHKYVKGLQDKGIKVLVTVLGDWQEIGVCSMNSVQTTKFAQILAHVVDKYGLDGIGFSDSYANNKTTVKGSFGEIITKLRALMPAGKLITVFQWGDYGSWQIDAAAGALIDYAYANFGYNPYVGIFGMTKDRFAPLSLNLGSYNNPTSAGDRAYELTEAGYGMIRNFNLRRSSEVDPTPLFKAYADGAYEIFDVVRDGGDRPQDWKFISGGYTITYTDTL